MRRIKLISPKGMLNLTPHVPRGTGFYVFKEEFSRYCFRLITIIEPILRKNR